MSFAGSGIPPSSIQAPILTAAYHEISVQVVGCNIRGLVLQDLSGCCSKASRSRLII